MTTIQQRDAKLQQHFDAASLAIAEWPEWKRAINLDLMSKTKNDTPRGSQMTGGHPTIQQRDAARFAALSASDEVIQRHAESFVQVHKTENEKPFEVWCLGMTIGRHETEQGATDHAELERGVVRSKLREFLYDARVAGA